MKNKEIKEGVPVEYTFKGCSLNKVRIGNRHNITIDIVVKKDKLVAFEATRKIKTSICRSVEKFYNSKEIDKAVDYCIDILSNVYDDECLIKQAPIVF